MGKTIITGVGVASCIGTNWATFQRNLFQGRSGISEIDLYDTSDREIKYAGVVSGINYSDYMRRKTVRHSGRAARLGIVAARQAYEDASLERFDPKSIGLITATCTADLTRLLDYYDSARKVGTRKSISMFSLFTNDMIAASIAIELGIKGPNFSVSCACASSNLAIMAAINLLDGDDEIEAVMVVGADSLVHEEVLDVLSGSGIFAPQENCDPRCIMRPYDIMASGLVVSEGAAAIVLQKRHSKDIKKCYGGILNADSNCDAYSVNCETNEMQLRQELIEQILAKSSLSVDDLDYINGYGISMLSCDVHELQALQNVLCTRKRKCPISSTKSILGHSFGSSAMLEILATIASINKKKLLPNINFTTPSVAADALEFATTVRTQEINYALKLSFGSGNRNTAVVLCSPHIIQNR